MSDNIRQLLESARNGCVAAFEELIEPHRNRIYSLMINTCGSEFEASLLTQEVFVRVFRSLAPGKDEVSLAFAIYSTAAEISRQAACKSKMIS